MSKSKILVQAVTPIVNRLNEKIKVLGLRRDIYLNSVFRDEVEHLVNELGGKCNSSKAKDYLVSKLRILPTTPVSILLDKDVIRTIDDACSSLNMARDCFINRIFFFLAAEAKHLKAIRIPVGALPIHLDDATVNPLDIASQFLRNPFAEIRQFIQAEDTGSGLYSWSFGGRLLGLNCHISNEYVPETKEYNDLESLFSV
ncbi:MAG: hypothetical protein Q7S46_12535 [Gallionella sp.]|nr:hypothetical protein [Gallionella sp.]